MKCRRQSKINLEPSQNAYRDWILFIMMIIYLQKIIFQQDLNINNLRSCEISQKLHPIKQRIVKIGPLVQKLQEPKEGSTKLYRTYESISNR